MEGIQESKKGRSRRNRQLYICSWTV